jgi:uncharacterized membrane protein
MEEAFKIIAGYVALAVEAAAVLMVAIGAARALVRLAFQTVPRDAGAFPHRALRQGFAGWILLSFEFALGADIIRTALNCFLAHDLENAMEMNQPQD